MQIGKNPETLEAEILGLFADWRRRHMWGTVRFIMKDGVPIDVVEQASRTYHLKCAAKGAAQGVGGPEPHLE